MIFDRNIYSIKKVASLVSETMPFRVTGMTYNVWHIAYCLGFGSMVLLLWFFPMTTSAQPNTFQELAFDVAKIIDTATITLIALGLVVYFWGIAVNIPHFGDEKGAEKQKSFFFWGLLVLFVMVSIWGILHLLQNTLFGNSPYDPATGEPAFTLCDGFGNCD